MQQTVEQVREASRELVRELGFMRPTLAGTPLSASAVHALIEIGRGPALTAGELALRLRLEKSSVSRMLAGLETRGEITALPEREDARRKSLALTAQGQATLADIDRWANARVSGALGKLDAPSQRGVAASLAAYARALGDRQAAPDVTVHAGYSPTIIGRCATLHAAYYSAAFGLGPLFERRVAGEFAEFAGRLGNRVNQAWSASAGGEIVGTIAIDGEDMGPDIAHLRWFIVDDGLRGSGVGRQLLSAALAHADALGRETRLWTFRGLDAARHLYEANGFGLIHEEPGTQWGSQVMEQMFSRPAQPSTR